MSPSPRRTCNGIKMSDVEIVSSEVDARDGASAILRDSARWPPF